MGLDRDVEGHHQAALEVHLVDPLTDLLEHLLVGHDHLPAEGPAHLDEAKRRGPALGDGLLGPAVVPEQLDGLKRGQDERVAPWRKRRGVPLEMQHLLDREIETLARARMLLRELARLDQLSLGVLDLDRDWIDRDQLLQRLAVFGVALEPDPVALDQELQHHVLDEGEDPQLGGEFYGAGLHLLVVARDLDLVAHGEGAPGVDAVLHQRLFQVVLPGLAGPLLPGGGNGFGGVDRTECRCVQSGGRGQGDEHVGVGCKRRGMAARRCGRSSGLWVGSRFHQGPPGRVLPLGARHSRPVARTPRPKGYLPEAEEKRRLGACGPDKLASR